MTEYDYWKIFPRMTRKVTIGDITIRDGFQHEEKFVSTAAKIFYLEELIFAGCRNIEVTNLGNPISMPQFRDAEQLLAHLRSDRFKSRCAKKESTTKISASPPLPSGSLPLTGPLPSNKKVSDRIGFS